MTFRSSFTAGVDAVIQTKLCLVTALLATFFLAAPPKANAAPCLSVTLTGTGAPPAFEGLAGPGTLVRYGDDTNDCSAILMQFDVGRGTVMRLSEVDVQAAQLNAVFFTHMHSDHVEGFFELAMQRWLFPPKGPKLDVICSADEKSPAGFDVSCSRFVANIAEAYTQSGEISQRETEGAAKGGPDQMIQVITFPPKDTAKVVWTSGDVKVSAIQSAHSPGHVAFRVDTPAGSVVIGGDAANDVLTPPRKTSTSDQVERLSKGVDIIVHTVASSRLSPEQGSVAPPAVYYGKSNATDLGAMAQRSGAKILMLTHLLPSLGAASLGPWPIPGGPMTEADYTQEVVAGGFTGKVVVGTDLTTVRLPAK